MDAVRLDALIHAIAAETMYGTAGGSSMQCNDLSDAAITRLTAAGYRARKAALLTMEPLNGRTDGHTLVEVFHPRFASWVVVDFSTDRLYGQTLWSFTQARMPYEALTDAPRDPAYADPDGVFEDLERWYNRVAQVALLLAPDGRFMYGAHPEAAERFAIYGWQYAYDPTFVQDFYGG